MRILIVYFFRFGNPQNVSENSPAAAKEFSKNFLSFVAPILTKKIIYKLQEYSADKGLMFDFHYKKVKFSVFLSPVALNMSILFLNQGKQFYNTTVIFLGQTIVQYDCKFP